LDAAVKQTRKYGFVPQEFDAELALGMLELQNGGTASGRRRLVALENDAKAKGFLLIARKASEALKHHSG
jgi:hypothetical protein